MRALWQAEAQHPDNTDGMFSSGFDSRVGTCVRGTRLGPRTVRSLQPAADDRLKQRGLDLGQ